MRPITSVTRFRRPVHPPLVHVPIGGVIAAGICDIVSTAGGSSHSAARYTPSGVLVLSLVAVAVVIAGGELGGRLVYRHGINVRLTGGPGGGHHGEGAEAAGRTGVR